MADHYIQFRVLGVMPLAAGVIGRPALRVVGYYQINTRYDLWYAPGSFFLPEHYSDRLAPGGEYLIGFTDDSDGVAVAVSAEALGPTRDG